MVPARMSFALRRNGEFLKFICRKIRAKMVTKVAAFVYDDGRRALVDEDARQWDSLRLMNQFTA